MSILFIQHVENEGPGIFRQVLHEHAIPFHTRKTLSSISFVLPGDCRGVIILGGPMNVDDESDYPFLVEEKAFIRELIRKDIPLLGICLGAQLIAQAAGEGFIRRRKKNSGGMRYTLPGKVYRTFFSEDYRSHFRSLSCMKIPFQSPPRVKALSPQWDAQVRDSRLENELTVFSFIWRLMPL